MRVDRALTLLSELEHGLKTAEFEADMGKQGLNSSFALLGVQALQAYLNSDVRSALEDFETLASEIAARSSRRGDPRR